MDVFYTPKFLTQLGALDIELQKEALEKISLFKNSKNHKQLKVHKLKGPLAGRYSFSVNYSTRIIFMYENSKTAILLVIGDHEVYK